MQNRTPKAVTSGVLSGARMVSSEDFTPVRAGFDSLALHHHYYTSDDKGIAMNKLKPESDACGGGWSRKASVVDQRPCRTGDLRTSSPKNNEQEAHGLPSTRRGFRDDGAALRVYNPPSFLSSCIQRHTAKDL